MRWPPKAAKTSVVSPASSCACSVVTWPRISLSPTFTGSPSAPPRWCATFPSRQTCSGTGLNLIACRKEPLSNSCSTAQSSRSRPCARATRSSSVPARVHSGNTRRRMPSVVGSRPIRAPEMFSTATAGSVLQKACSTARLTPALANAGTPLVSIRDRRAADRAAPCTWASSVTGSDALRSPRPPRIPRVAGAACARPESCRVA